LSLTELEFNEARRLGRPVLLFIMGPEHLVKESDVEIDSGKRKKLEAFREKAKPLTSESPVHRVYKVFNSLQDFEREAILGVAELRRYLDETEPPAESQQPGDDSESDPIPKPPAFYAEPPYIGSHQFVGRDAQLTTLSDWAAAADPHPVLLFEAIGGSGKSMLTWEWTTKHATAVRGDWTGRFWYSFYEKGAVMADFCRRTLAYMTERPLEDYRKKKMAELSDLLLRQLRARPWLLVLDGLERVLIAYHRFDAAQLADEEAGSSDQIAKRDPSTAIRPDDDELLRSLAGAAPSKLLLTSRLVPHALLNPGGQAIPGVLHDHLPGLRPPDAEALLRSCRVRGTSQDIQDYLRSHCDCHPLVTGVLAGLINDYLQERGNFDAWVDARDGGAALNLADLDLVQKRNHILRSALDALPDKSRQLLSTLALLSEAVDVETLNALNPHLPPEPENAEVPEKPEDGWRWNRMSGEEKQEAQQQYRAALQRRNEYEEAVEVRRSSAAFLDAPRELAKTVRDLERRGLLQYDGQARRYDLHPVVRGVAAGGLRQEERESYGQRVVDHFSARSHNPYDEAETLDDLRDGLHVVRTFMQMGRYQEAAEVLEGDLTRALLVNLEASTNVISLLRPFFANGWSTLPADMGKSYASSLANDAGWALGNVGELTDSLAANGVSLQADMAASNWLGVIISLNNISSTLMELSRVAAVDRASFLALALAECVDEQYALFIARLNLFGLFSRVGRMVEAEEVWNLLEPMGRDWESVSYRSGTAEEEFAWHRLRCGALREEHIVRAKTLARDGKNREVIRKLHALRGEWRLEEGEWNLAADSLHEAIRMGREVELRNGAAEAQLALVNFHLGRLGDPRAEAENLAGGRRVADGDLAALWLAIGDKDEAKKYALAAYKWAWADGEPYVRRYELNKARALLEQLGAEVPTLPPYDPAKDPKLPWEDDIAAAIEKLRAEKAAKEKNEGGEQ
jgi:hypothetical protein